MQTHRSAQRFQRTPPAIVFPVTGNKELRGSRSRCGPHRNMRNYARPHDYTRSEDCNVRALTLKDHWIIQPAAARQWLPSSRYFTAPFYEMRAERVEFTLPLLGRSTRGANGLLLPYPLGFALGIPGVRAGVTLCVQVSLRIVRFCSP